MYVEKPSYQLINGKILQGWNKLSSFISDKEKVDWILEGPHYLNWNLIIKSLDLEDNIEFINFQNCLLDRKEINKKIGRLDLRLDKDFGVYCKDNISTFYSPNKIDYLRKELKLHKQNNKNLIIFGAGSSMLIDITTNIVWVEHPIKNINNDPLINTKKLFGSYLGTPSKSYQYIDEPISDKNRSQVFNRVSIYAYLPSINNLKFIFGAVIRENINHLSEQPFRLKPIFFEKLWGGQYLRTYLNKESEFDNIAGSYEMLSHKNGVLFKDNDLVIEIPFPLFYSINPKRILGDKVVNLYGNCLPFRLNLTDTIDGQDLSCQVHPTCKYNRKVFHMNEFMEEKYYVIRTSNNSKVNLGFINRINLQKFKTKLLESEKNNVPFNLYEYVKGWHTQKGQVFYIPPGTIHNICSNNLIMEIISTSYIVTLRLYDYLRTDKKGESRQLNISEAWKNLDTTATEKNIKKNYIPDKSIHKNNETWVEYRYNPPSPTQTILSEIEFIEEYEETTKGKLFHTLNLVEGERIEIICGNNIHPLNYLETIFVPAAATEYKLINHSGSKCKVLKVKPYT